MEFAFLIMMLGIFFLPLLIICGLFAASYWKLFTKAGRQGWRALIPFWSAVTFCEIARVPRWYASVISGGIWGSILLIVLSAIITIASPIMTGGSFFIFGFFSFTMIVSLIAPVLMLAAMIFRSIVLYKLAAPFGKGDEFGIALVFIEAVFIPVLAFGQAEYIYKEESDSNFSPCGKNPSPIIDFTSNSDAFQQNFTDNSSTGPVIVKENRIPG